MPQPLWIGSGQYEVKVVGASYHRAWLAELAGNRAGQPAMTFCTADLALENDNPHDPNAMLVLVAGRPVGHIPKLLAPSLRAALLAIETGHRITAANAAVTGGVSTVERDYEYVVELDIDMPNPRLDVHGIPAFDKVTRLPPNMPWTRQEDGSFLVKAWLPVSSYDDLHPKRRLMLWTVDDWDVVNCYAMNHKGIGLGHKLFSVSKTQWLESFGNVPVRAGLEALRGRVATVRLWREPAASVDRRE